MTRNFFILTIVTILFTSLIGCATFANYKAKTTDEEEIKKALLNYWKAWDDTDAEGILSFIHEDARMMTGRYGAVVSKQQYSAMLQQIFAQGYSFTKGSPKMNVKGDEAIVKVRFSDGVSLFFTFNLVRENGRWYIMSEKYL